MKISLSLLAGLAVLAQTSYALPTATDHAKRQLSGGQITSVFGILKGEVASLVGSATGTILGLLGTLVCQFT